MDTKLVCTLVIVLSAIPDDIELSDISEVEVDVIVLSDKLDTEEFDDSKLPLAVIVLSAIPLTLLLPASREPNTTERPAAPAPVTVEFPDTSETVDVTSLSPVPVNDGVVLSVPEPVTILSAMPATEPSVVADSAALVETSYLITYPGSTYPSTT